MKAAALFLSAALLAGCAPKPAGGHLLTGWARSDAPRNPDPTLPPDESKTRTAAPVYHPQILYFAFNSNEIRDTEADKLREMADRLTGACVIEGNASPEGAADYNLALGHRRAESVLEYLRLANCKAKMDLISYGAERPVSNNDPDFYWMDRRVEVVCE